jgi:outer membrane biosynthesis protein TonB
VALARERGDAVTVLPPKEVLRWRRATEPVIAAWLKQMKERRIDGDKLLADIRELLEKYAGEPEPPPPRPPPPPPEQKVVAQPQPRPEAKVEPPKPAAPAPAATPAAKPPPAAASRPKELDIPL